MHKAQWMLIGIIVASMVLGVLYGLTEKAEAHTGYYRVADTAGNGLNLRTGPSGDYRVIMTMARGARLKAYGHRGNWMKVQHLATGYIGWAFMTYIVADTTGGGGGGGGTTSGLQLCFPNSWGQTYCAAQWIADAAWSAARYWGASYWWLMSMASCESNFVWNAYNPASEVSGILQFEPSTFYWMGGSNLWSVAEQFFIAAKMYVRGMQGHWACNARF